MPNDAKEFRLTPRVPLRHYLERPFQTGRVEIVGNVPSRRYHYIGFKRSPFSGTRRIFQF